MEAVDHDVVCTYDCLSDEAYEAAYDDSSGGGENGGGENDGSWPSTTSYLYALADRVGPGTFGIGILATHES